MVLDLRAIACVAVVAFVAGWIAALQTAATSEEFRRLVEEGAFG